MYKVYLQYNANYVNSKVRTDLTSNSVHWNIQRGLRRNQRLLHIGTKDIIRTTWIGYIK